jgi:hypothetical protein
MASVTLAQLRTRVRQRADMEESTFVSDSELTGYINASADELYDVLVGKFVDQYVAEAPLITGVGLPAPLPLDLTGSTVALPSDFYKLLDVSLQADGEWCRLKHYVWREATELRNASTTLEDTRYQLQGSRLKLLPTPPEGLNLNVAYVPTRPQMAADADVLEGCSGWEEYVVVDAAAKCRDKEETDTSILLAAKAALLVRIEKAAENREPTEPASVVDVHAGGWAGGDW